ncbi:hypothetical protein MTO96_037977 [Rhipicephalus appendiculatus]
MNSVGNVKVDTSSNAEISALNPPTLKQTLRLVQAECRRRFARRQRRQGLVAYTSNPTETVGSSFEEYSALASHNCSWSQQQAVALYRMSHYVFVYGTLKSGETNHRILTDPVNGRSTLLGQARTLKKWPLEVHGEVYQVDDRMLEVLDRLESHPDYYVRSQEDVFMLPQPKASTDANVEGTTPTPPTEAGDRRKAWIYFLRKFERQLLSLPVVPHYTRKPGIEWPELKGDETARRFLDNGFQHIAASALSACRN